MTHAEEKSHEVAARKMLSANQGERYQEKKKKKPTNISSWTSSWRTVKKYISVVQATQSFVSCYGGSNKPTQTNCLSPANFPAGWVGIVSSPD